MELKHFKLREFKCPCGCGGDFMEENFLLMLDEVRDMAGFPFIVTSGYRCPEYNNRISSTGRNGPHTTGKAADLHLLGQEAFAAIPLFYDGGILGEAHGGLGLKQTGEHDGRFVHVDSLTDDENSPRPWVWT